MIITPETHPNHDVVGRHWKSAGVVYFCDSYDSSCGYWMTPIEDNPENDGFGFPLTRKNVSERAIGRTFHYQWRMELTEE